MSGSWIRCFSKKAKSDSLLRDCIWVKLVHISNRAAMIDRNVKFF